MRSMIPALAVLFSWGCAPDSGKPAAPPPSAAPPAEAAGAASDGPEVSNAWIRSVPPGAHMTAGYLTVHNPGPDPLVIVGVESPLFGAIEMHGTVVTDGVARMRQQDTVTVAPGDSVRFEPGGLHLMLMQPTGEIPAGGVIEFSLLLDDEKRIEFAAPVGQPGS